MRLTLEANGDNRADIVALLEQAIAMIDLDGESETQGDELSFTIVGE